jgi:hypothetical protein
MGVVKITENIGDGRYKIELVKNIERAKALKAFLEKQIEKLKVEIKDLKKKLPELENKIDDKRIELELARQKFIDDTDNVAYLETFLNTLNQTIEQLEKRLKAEKETKAAIDKIIDGGNVSSNMTLGGFPIINDIGGPLSATRRATKAKIKDLLTPTAEGPPVGEIVANSKRRKGAALGFNYKEITIADINATRLATRGKFKDFNIGPGDSTEIGIEAYSRRTKVVALGEVFPTQPKISKKEFLAGDLTTVRTQIKGVFKTQKLFTDEPTEGELKAYRKGMKPLMTIIHAGEDIEGKVEASRKATKGKFKDAAPPEADRPSSEILATRKGTDANITGELVLKTQPQAESYYQAVSDSKQDVIDGLNQRLSELTQEKNEILNQIKDLRDPTDLIKEYEQILSEMTQVVMTKQGIETNIKKNEITLDKKEKLQRDFDKTITQPDIRPAWCVDYALDLYIDLDEIQREADAVQVQIDNLKQGSYTTQNHLNDMISAGATNDDPTVKNIKAALKSNDEEITSLKFRKEAILSSVYRLSVDINDENELILIAPHTYEPIEKDVSDKETYISIKIAAKDKLDEDDNKLFNEITDRGNKVDAKYIEINGLSLQIAAIDVSSNPEEQTQRRKNLQEKIDKLRDEIHDLNREIIKLKREKNLNRSKADKLAKLILRLNEELVNLNATISSPERIFKPKVTDRTPRFQPTQSSSPEAVFFNKSLLPGFQKWKPSFRLGVITAIYDNDLCDVTLEDATSSQQDLNINQHKLLTNVRIKYGSCNSGAFAVNDRVVVEFSEREQDRPTVIGFEDNPKPCGGLVCLPSSDTAPKGWGKPITDENKPLGTIDGDLPKATLRFVKTASGYQASIRRNSDMRGGCCLWSGDKGNIITWHGPFGNAIAPPIKLSTENDLQFYGYRTTNTFLEFSQPTLYAVAQQRFSTFIYVNGRLRYGHDTYILGAGMLGKYIVFVTNVSPILDSIFYLNDDNQSVFIGHINASEPGYMYTERTNIYSFSSSGKKASTLLHATKPSFNPQSPNIRDERYFFMYVTIPRITLDLDESGFPFLVNIAYESRLNDFIISSSLTENVVLGEIPGETVGSQSSSSYTTIETRKTLAIGYDKENEITVDEFLVSSGGGTYSSSGTYTQGGTDFVFTNNSSSSASQVFKAGNDILFSTSSARSLSTVDDETVSPHTHTSNLSVNDEAGYLVYYSFHNEGWWCALIEDITNNNSGTTGRISFQTKGKFKQVINNEIF